ncbi:TaqI-like C-terminal specificity domain-containing protein [Brachyspira sp. SAP_772]|uniref:TaqI-like C-terminal specificity domain-containing protein n=1 Tax=Brachyspira sp. SAP_772 TaxID=2608385 RepID=UPI0012F4A5A7|nr:TaqI-like C-terminal specificity domain-containing protein [Brachyspira sp. SAP_772]
MKNSEIIKPVLVDDSLLKYRINFNNKYLINTHNGVKSENIPPIDINNYKDIKTYIDNSVEEIKKGVMKRKGGHTTNNKSFFDRSDMGYTPYNHRNCAYLLEFEKPKIVWKQTSKYQTFMLDTEGYYITVSAHMLTINDNDLNKLKYILSILNSKLFKYYMFSVATNFSGVGIRWIPAFIENVPIPEPDKDTENKLVNLVDNIIDLNKKLSSEKNPNTIEMLSTRIQAVDAAIDKIVYSLYGLDAEEIKIIEGE